MTEKLLFVELLIMIIKIKKFRFFKQKERLALFPLFFSLREDIITSILHIYFMNL